MKEEDRKEFVKLLNETLDGRDRIDAVTHKIHHDLIAEDIENRQIKRERWETIRRQVIGWGIVTILLMIGTAVYNYFFTVR